MSERSLHLDEPLVRVAAIGFEGLARSRPQRPLADAWSTSDAGFIDIEAVYLYPGEYDWDRVAMIEFVRWKMQLFWVRWGVSRKDMDLRTWSANVTGGGRANRLHAFYASVPRRARVEREYPSRERDHHAGGARVMSERFEDFVFLTEDEALIRVLAAGVQSYFQSHPTVSPAWMIRSGKAPIQINTEAEWRSGIRQRGRYLKPISLLFGPDEMLGFYEKAARHNLPKLHLFRLDNGKWRKAFYSFRMVQSWPDSEDLSQEEAERLAARAFTHPFPIRRVSDEAILFARRKLWGALSSV